MSSKEKFALAIIKSLFVIRYWAILGLVIALAFGTYWISKQPDVQLRDTIAFFTGGWILIVVFYHVINYEYNLRKFKHDVKTSKDLLSFNTALEYQKEFVSKNYNLARKFFVKHKQLIDDGQFSRFQTELEKEENEDSYNALLATLNFYESIALGVKQGIMDEEFIRGFFETVFRLNHNRYSGYIEFRRREKQNLKIWHNFTELSTKWINC